MRSLKTLTIAAALIAGATSLAIAQTGPATGGQQPAAGGAAGNPAAAGPSAKSTHKHKQVKQAPPATNTKQ
jgi:hypothetical protein